MAMTPSCQLTWQLTLSRTSPGFNVSAVQVFKNTVGKGEIAQNEQFLLSPIMFSTDFENVLPFSLNLKLLSANFFSFEESKICRLGKGLTIFLKKKYCAEFW